MNSGINNRLSRTIILTALALTAFAANSVFCRLALGNGAIDAASFTIIRLASGSVVLFIIISASGQLRAGSEKGSWLASLMLFIYAASFSYAYYSLDTGTGALILFGAVQITMILWSLKSGTRLLASEWAGVVVAFGGFVYLVLPGVSKPSITGFLLMTGAGIAWGFYTLKGRGSKNPLQDTAWNFLRTSPLLLLLGSITLSDAQISAEGVIWALLSGGLTSGIGYTLWYIALGGLSATQAAVLQLSVPVIAALGGVMFVSEAITLRLTVSTLLILGGILMVVLGRYYVSRRQSG